MTNDTAYQNHAVFARLSEYADFYESLSDLVFHWVSVGTHAMANIDSYVYSSIHGTLSSIRLALQDGQMNDAYCLLRQYYDSAVINVYSMLYLQDHFSVKTLVVAQIQDWLNGTSRLPSFGKMAAYIRASKQVASVTKLLCIDGRYERIRDRCNDHVHCNFYGTILLNNRSVRAPNRAKALEAFSRDLVDVFVMHFAYIFSAREHYMMASDHVDSLELGLRPEPESEYWVAPFIQRAYDSYVKKARPDLGAILKSETSMHLV